MATILVVDDRSINLRYLGTLLRLGEHRVLEARDGSEALARIRDAPPDLIITDLLMPGMDGIEFARRVRAGPDSEHIPIVVYTAADRVGEARSLAQSWGVSAVLGKPSDADTVLRTVHELLGLPLNAPAAARPVVHELLDGTPREAGTDRLATRLGALLEQGLALSTCRDPLHLLDISCRAAQHILGAGYAAIGVLDEHGTRLAHFFVRGLQDTDGALAADWDPRGGLLGQVLTDLRPRRAHGPAAATSTLGLPPRHPPVASFLAVPLVLQGGPYGWLYLADKSGAAAFDAEDERIAATLAAQLGSAQESLSLYDKLERRSAALEREVAQRQEAEAEVRRLNAELERRVAERTAELQASQQRLSTIADNMPALISYLDGEQRFRFVNKTYQEWFGVEPAQMIGMSLREFYGDAVAARIRPHIEAALSGREMTYERELHGAGEHRYAHAHLVPHRDDAGQVIGLYTLIHDITPRRLAEQALQDSEARYRAIVEDQTELISLARRDGRLTFVNAAYARHFGFDPEQMVGRNLLDFVDEADRAAVQAHLESVCLQRSAASDVNRMKSASGETRWVAWTNRPIEDAAGQVVALQSVGRDITQQRLAEQKLAESEQRYRSLYESTPAILHSIDAQGRLLTVSDLWLRVMGYERTEVIGHRSSDFLTPDSARRAREVVLPEFFRTGRCDRVEYQFVRKDGSLIDVLLSAILERDEAGEPVRSFAVLEDITEAKRLAAELGRTHAHLDAIVDNVPALLGQWDKDGTTRFVNREYQAAVGLPMEQIVGRPLREIHDLVDPVSYTLLAPRVAAVLQGHRQEFDFPMLTTSGLRHLRMTLVPDQPQDGRVAGYYGMAHDITGRKALELRLTDSERRYRSLFDNLNSGFALHEIVVDTDGKPSDYKFLAMNGAFAIMCGLEPASTIGKRATELRSGIELVDGIDRYGQVALSGQPVHFEQHAAPADRWFEIVAYRPAPGQFAVIAQDVSQRKQAEARLQQALMEKETLLKEVYHRVKNNLQVVQSLLSLQHRSMPDGPARAALDDSVQRVRAMALVHEKLYQAGNLAAVSLQDYTQDLLKQIGEAMGVAQKGILLQAEIAPVQTGLDNAIPFGLLVAELVGNALKHGLRDRHGGLVRVLLVPQASGAHLSVSDDGAGLPGDFDLLTVSSMGLQLASVLAGQLGGELQATTGRGATFGALLTRL